MEDFSGIVNTSLIEILGKAMIARASLFDQKHEAAFRLLNGFTEGYPDLAVDLYGQTLLIHDYAVRLDMGEMNVIGARDFYQHQLPWLNAIMVKSRHATNAQDRIGKLIAGADPARRVKENGVWYAVDVTLNRDAGLYLDTRNLRGWVLRNLNGARVLNTFAYTGSLGVAAKAAGATRVVHIDLNRAFLNVAKTSYTLNGFPIDKSDFISGDFWPQVSRLIRRDELFDCVILDPPFFAETRKGTVDVENNYARLINKVRPLIADGGRLIAINNAVFVSGADYMRTLESLGEDGYLTVEELIPVSEDFTGYETTRAPAEMIDPAPFNHSTKTAVLKVRRKDGRKV